MKADVKKKEWFWLLIYGSLWAAFLYGITVARGVDSTVYMSERINLLQQMMDYISGTSDAALAGVRDHNASLFFYLAVFAQILHISTPEKVFLVAQLVAAAINVLFVPLIMYYLFDRNKIIAALSPVFWMICEGLYLIIMKTDSYWGIAWTITMSLPLLFLLIKREWDRGSFILWLCLLLIMGVGNVPRMHSSLAILCVTIAVVCVKVSRKKLLLKSGMVLLCLVSYFMFTTIIPGWYSKILGIDNIASNTPPWHTIYLSYGFEENPYGIMWNDTFAADKVEEIRPGIKYLSEEYFDVLRLECFRMWRERPFYFAGSYIRKFILCMSDIFMLKQNVFLSVGIVLLLFFEKCRDLGKWFYDRQKQCFLWVTLMVLFFEAIFPMLAIPHQLYSMGIWATWGILMLLFLCYCTEDIEIYVKEILMKKGKLHSASLQYNMAGGGIDRSDDQEIESLSNKRTGEINNPEERRQECMICGSRLTACKIPGLMQCPGCGFITTDLHLSSEELKKIYSFGYYNGEEYADYTLDKVIIQRNFRRRLRRIEKFLSDTHRRSLFEIGCAYGFFLQEAEKRFEYTAGIDISEDAIRYAVDELGMNAHAGDYSDYNDARKYDIICMWDTIEHLTHPERYVEKAWKNLKEGGLLCVTTGDIGSLNARMRGRKWRQIHPPTHLHYFSRDTLEKLLEIKGFELLDVSYPANTLSMNNILYTLFCLKSNYKKVYELFKDTWISRINIDINLHDFMFLIARKREGGDHE